MSYVGRPPEYGGYEKQDITTDGSTTTFALNYTVGSESSLLVSVAGVNQQPGVAYTLSGGGANIVFSAAPASTATTFVIFLGYAFDSGVLLGTGTITGQTAVTSLQNADKFLVYDNSAAALKKVDFQYVHVALSPTTRTATGDGSTTGFTVTTGTTVDSVFVFLNGVCQVPTTDYTISSTTLTFTTAPVNGDAIQIREL
tara:strand:+ start:3014 stop:3610 length:597 start_codon:yes stop_codon:yes gene_type:complete